MGLQKKECHQILFQMIRFTFWVSLYLQGAAQWDSFGDFKVYVKLVKAIPKVYRRKWSYTPVR